jgi:hypothetical protein
VEAKYAVAFSLETRDGSPADKNLEPHGERSTRPHTERSKTMREQTSADYGEAHLSRHGIDVHLIPRRKGDVQDPRGGVRGVIPGKAAYCPKLREFTRRDCTV